jgi:phosphonate transport system permease protein
MLPAILALGLHNGAIIAHLIGRQADAMTPGLRADAPSGLNLYGYEYVPRLYGSFLAYAFCRWEIILRESGSEDPLAILTALGLPRAQALGAVRLSLGRATTRADVERAAALARAWRACARGLKSARENASPGRTGQ